MAEIMDMEVEEGLFFIENVEDEKIQARMDMFGLQGVDLTDYSKSHTEFYAKWQRRKRMRSGQEEKNKPIAISPEKAKAIHDAFNTEIDRIVTRRHLRKIK